MFKLMLMRVLITAKSDPNGSESFTFRKLLKGQQLTV